MLYQDQPEIFHCHNHFQQKNSNPDCQYHSEQEIWYQYREYKWLDQRSKRKFAYTRSDFGNIWHYQNLFCRLYRNSLHNFSELVLMKDQLIVLFLQTMANIDRFVWRNLILSVVALTQSILPMLITLFKTTS